MLPIYDVEKDILSAVKESDTVIISAETGSGKSTQVPQILFHAGYDVIVTEPRRIAAISLADRVAYEMKDSGKVVGYHTAFEKSVSDATHILYCTDGLQVAKGISSFENTVLVIDEVHEWNLNIETLIAWVNYARSKGNSIKVVLMSATMDVENILNYFDGAVAITAGGQLFDVEKHQRPSVELVPTIAEAIRSGKNCLVFVSGKAGINSVKENLPMFCTKDEYEFIPLHSELSHSEQARCFLSYDKPKVVCATNIAQTSITIPDIDVVVDTGMEKRVEIEDGIEGLYEVNISQSDIIQRAGRAGRVKDGKYYLCSELPIDERREYAVPEIQRLSLEKVALKLASVGIDIEDLTFIHQPSKEKIAEAKEALLALGALNRENNITPVGKKLVNIPVSVQYGRMIVEAEKYGKEVLDDVIVIASICEAGTLLKHKTPHKLFPYRNYDLSDFSDEKQSDLIAELDLYRKIQAHTWDKLAENGINGKAFSRAKEFRNKMMESLKHIVSFRNGVEVPDRHKALIQCIIAGFLNNLYKSTLSGYTTGEFGSSFQLSRNSVVENPAEFGLGKPITITYKNRFGWENTMDILTNVTSATFDEIKPFISESDFSETYDEQASVYDVAADVFHVAKRLYFRQFLVREETLTLPSSDMEQIPLDLRQRLMFKAETEKDETAVLGGKKYRVDISGRSGERYVWISNKSELDAIPDNEPLVTLGGKPFVIEYGVNYYSSVAELKAALAKEEADSTCVIDGVKHSVYKDIYNKFLYITLWEREVLALSPDVSAKTLSGIPVRIDINGKMYNSIKEAYNAAVSRKRLDDERRNKERLEVLFRDFEKSLPSPTSNVELLKEGFHALGAQNIGGQDVFVGLKNSKKSVGYALFDEEKSAEDSTKEALQFLIDNYVGKYSDKSFFEKMSGQKVQTVKSVRAKTSFYNFVADLKNDVSADSIGDALSMIDEMYSDCVAELKQA